MLEIGQAIKDSAAQANLDTGKQGIDPVSGGGGSQDQTLHYGSMLYV